LKIGLNIRVKGWHTGMYDSTTFPTSNQLAGRAPPARLGAIPERLALAAHRRSSGGDQRGISQWLSRAKADGPQALRHRKPTGRRSKLTHQQRLQLLELLTQGPQALSFRGDGWTQPRVAQIIRRHFGVQYHPSQVGRILKQYAWSRQKPLRRASQRWPSGTGKRSASPP
jgi:transposase